MHKRYGALSSSVNPMELAGTVIGIIRLLAGMAVSLGFITAEEMGVIGDAADSVLTQIGIIVPAGIALWGAVETVFGLIRKVVVRISDRTRRAPGVGASVGAAISGWDPLRKEYKETDPSLHR